jgi:gliding motility-associated protein GldM
MKSLNWILLFAIMAAMLGGCTHRSSNDTNSLNAFKTINESIERSNAMIDERNNHMERAMEAEKKFQPGKVNELMGILKDVRIKSSDIDTYIKGLITELNKSENDGDVSVVSRLLADGKDGDSLRAKLQTYSMDIAVLMGSKYQLPVRIPIIPIDISIPDTEEGRAASSWQKAFFKNVPKVAAITILNKFDNDVKTTEAMCVDRLAKEAVALEIILDHFMPLVSTKSSHIHLGENYEALIGLGAFSSTVPAEIFVGDKQMEVKDGQALYTVTTNKVGTFTVPVIIKLPRRNGGYEQIQNNLQYTVHR